MKTIDRQPCIKLWSMLFISLRLLLIIIQYNIFKTLKTLKNQIFSDICIAFKIYFNRFEFWYGLVLNCLIIQNNHFKRYNIIILSRNRTKCISNKVNDMCINSLFVVRLFSIKCNQVLLHSAMCLQFLW
jgi:hypothetical protein